MRRALRTVALPAGLSALAFAVLYAPSAVLAGGVPDWLPSLGPPEFTATVYLQAGSVVGTTAVLAGALALGYREAGHRDVFESYLRYVGAVLAGGAGAVVLTVLVLVAGDGGNPFDTVLTAATALVGVPGFVAVSALAGAGLASLGRPDPASAPSVRRSLSLGPAAAVVTGLGVALDAAVDVLVATTEGVGLPAFLPQSWSIGSTLVTYLQLTRLASDLVLLAGGLALGYLAVRRLGVEAPSRRFAAVVVLGGFAGFWVAWLPATAVLAATPSGSSLAALAVAVPGRLLSTAAVATVAAVAGVAVARFGTDRPDAADGEGVDSTGGDPAARPR
ncbi:hypothetical protein C475_07691 [Halosimplex carlsbadense 2-9-1]|uniref:Uncharacterized protein n=1 Tax=Halosimplex carlsbadense 2-9-1 TaxID=797114 RepID=M0CY28_9EURY|nr:hypothetical protein [Halosimplex carlsbadense]ELZ26799.1 hypothetical protein C475_07691 [Halosimplex carlsbadense 2-9-1]